MPPRLSLRSFFRHYKPPLANLPKSPPKPRFLTNPPLPPPPPKSPESRLPRILDRLPSFLRPYTSGLRNAPVSHVTSFLILHELTAIIPLLGLATLFHSTNWLPQGWAEARWIREGVEKYGRYFGRKGWFGFSPSSTPSTTTTEVQSAGGIETAATIEAGSVDGKEMKGQADADVEDTEKRIEQRWHVGEKGSRILVEVATAYAITKVFLPARIVLSVWCTPWFARVVLGRFGGLFGRGKSAAKAAETVTKKMP